MNKVTTSACCFTNSSGQRNCACGAYFEDKDNLCEACGHHSSFHYSSSRLHEPPLVESPMETKLIKEATGEENCFTKRQTSTRSVSPPTGETSLKRKICQSKQLDFEKIFPSADLPRKGKRKLNQQVLVRTRSILVHVIPLHRFNKPIVADTALYKIMESAGLIKEIQVASSLMVWNLTKLINDAFPEIADLDWTIVKPGMMEDTGYGSRHKRLIIKDIQDKLDVTDIAKSKGVNLLSQHKKLYVRLKSIDLKLEKLLHLWKYVCEQKVTTTNGVPYCIEEYERDDAMPQESNGQCAYLLAPMKSKNNEVDTKNSISEYSSDEGADSRAKTFQCKPSSTHEDSKVNGILVVKDSLSESNLAIPNADFASPFTNRVSIDYNDITLYYGPTLHTNEFMEYIRGDPKFCRTFIKIFQAESASEYFPGSTDLCSFVLSKEDEVIGSCYSTFYCICCTAAVPSTTAKLYFDHVKSCTGKVESKFVCEYCDLNCPSDFAKTKHEDKCSKNTS